MSTEKWLCILNPRSGRRRGAVAAALEAGLKGKIALRIITFNQSTNIEDLRQEIRSCEEQVILAAGGDGTVSFVASCLMGTNKVLGPVPLGSGNGLARTLGFHMNLQRVITELQQKKIQTIDGASVNGRPFFCTSGVGFDAHIGGLFALSEKRGLRSYVKIIVKELLNYKPQTYTIHFNGQTITLPAFLVTLANAGQYGNNFFIAPQAGIQDGLLHLVILKPFSLFRSLLIFIRVFMRHAHLSSSIKTFSSPKVTITREREGPIHCDGEPIMEGKELVFEILPGALRVLTGPRFNGN